jgi:hypothetical protein
MLGVGRNYTSRVIQTFKAEGILQTRRGSVVVRDHDALVARSCLCYNSVKAHFDSVLRPIRVVFVTSPGEACERADNAQAQLAGCVLLTTVRAESSMTTALRSFSSEGSS